MRIELKVTGTGVVLIVLTINCGHPAMPCLVTEYTRSGRVSRSNHVGSDGVKVIVTKLLEVEVDKWNLKITEV